MDAGQVTAAVDSTFAVSRWETWAPEANSTLVSHLGMANASEGSQS